MRALPCLAFVAVMLTAASALAQEYTAAELIEHGVALREDGRDDEALAIFQRAYDTEPSAQALAQIALAEQALGHLVDAEEHLAHALEDHDDRFIRRNRPLLEQALAEISAELTTLTITCDVAGAELFVDGRDRGPLPLATPLRAQAGTVHVEIHAAGYEPYTREVIVSAGRAVSLAAVLEPTPASTEPSPPPPPQTPPPPVHTHDDSAAAWRMPLGIGLAAAGVVAFAVGGGLMAWREDNARARLTCSDTEPDCRARYQTAYDAETAGITTFVVGGLLVAAGAGVLVWDLLDGHASSSEARLTCAPGVLGLGCTGHF
ncbi:MAG: PEGA domain-containing protein [Sandaracinus sp.]